MALTDLLMHEGLLHPPFTSVRMKEEPLMIRRTAPILSLTLAATTVERELLEDSLLEVLEEVFQVLLHLALPSTLKILWRIDARRREETRRGKQTTKVSNNRRMELDPQHQLVEPLLLSLYPNSLLLFPKYPSKRVSHLKIRNVERSSKS